MKLKLTKESATRFAGATFAPEPCARSTRCHALIGWALAIVGLGLAADVLASDQLVEEAVVQTWRYETISAGHRQTIRRIEPHRSGADVYYPRFEIWRDCFESSKAAVQNLENIRRAKETDVVARDFDYRRGFVIGPCVYLMNTNALLYKIEFLDELLLKYEAFIRARP